MEDNRDILVLLCQFIRHRTKTHEVKPKECKTCKESDNIINYLINKYSDQETIEYMLLKIEELSQIA